MPTRRLLLAAGAAAFAMPRSAPARAAPAARPSAPTKPGGKAAPATPGETPLGPVDSVARWAFINDFSTGATLFDKAAEERMPPSSMTKMMTEYIVYSMLASGRLKLDQQLPVSEKAWRMGGSKMFVPLNGLVTVQDLIRGVIVDSGNDAAIVLAEGVSGSEDQFVELMNAQAQKFGLRNTHFANCTGWPADDHYSCARDLAAIATHLIRDYPQYYHYDSETTFTYDKIKQGNRNTLVSRRLADGLKTGHTDAGGYGLCASSLRGGRRVVMVLNGMPSSRDRAEEGVRLMGWAFAQFEDVTLFTAAEPVEHARVYLGAQPTVPLVAGHDLVITMPRSWRQTAKVTVDYQAPVRAPVKQGQVIGKLTVAGQGVPQTEIPLLAGTDVPRMSLPGRALAVLSHYVTGS